MMEKNIRVALENDEPRAIILSVKVDENPDRNTIDVTVVFKPINGFAAESVEIILERLR